MSEALNGPDGLARELDPVELSHPSVDIPNPPQPLFIPDSELSSPASIDAETTTLLPSTAPACNPARRLSRAPKAKPTSIKLCSFNTQKNYSTTSNLLSSKKGWLDILFVQEPCKVLQKT